MSGAAQGVPTHEAAHGGSRAVVLFASFAFAYFLSALLRAVTATLAPAFSSELGLGAADLGLLAGAYFLGFAALQLPLGTALDRHGAKRVLMVFLCVAVLACAGFAMARSLNVLILSRALIGVGVSACLMAPLTSFRHRFSPALQMRVNSWMLMTGSLGMLASTLPVQWLLPMLGWRGLFWAVAALLALAVVILAIGVPSDEPVAQAPPVPRVSGYRAVFTHPTFLRLAPMAFFHYGGLVAVQSLWAGPWLTDVGGRSAREAAQGLFAINLSMLCAFLGWGLVMPRLVRRRWDALRLISWGVPFSLAMLATNVALGAGAGAGWWALWCVSCTFISLSQPALAQAFPAQQAGRALSGYNLVIFLGVFTVQWGIGLSIDGLVQAGMARPEAHRWSMGFFGLCCLLAYGWFMLREPGRMSSSGRRG